MKKIIKSALACAIVAGCLSSLPNSYVYAGASSRNLVRDNLDLSVKSYSKGLISAAVSKEELNTEIPEDYEINEATQGKASEGAYNAYFLDDDIQVVKLVVDEKNLEYLFENAADKPTVMAESVTIGDATVKYVGLKTKGSFTLEHSVLDNPDNDRYSLSINFGKYIKKADYGDKQNFFGCNKISFNNFFFDKSMMKEFFSLKLMHEMGLPAPQFGIAKLYINDEYYGVYAMVENMDYSILQQYYECGKSDLSSYLCKPEYTRFLYSEISEDPSPLWEQDEDTLKDVEDMIPTVTEWVRKLNLLSEGKDFDGNAIDVNSEEYVKLLNQIMDVNETVKYFAVHSWLCQIDNMFDGMKNFGLYVDLDGRSVIVPWDYDLSFGCFYPSTPERTANYDIDLMFKDDWIYPGWDGTPAMYSSKEEVYSNYPLFNVIYQNAELMDKYHAYMRECSQIATLGGEVESTGKYYDPAYFNSYIDIFSDKLAEAASEELADHVAYMNGVKQPVSVKNALPNLSKIIAMRSMGVVLQVDGIDAMVSSKGCALETLGNALNDYYNQNWGKIVSINYQTGINLMGDYNDAISAPLLSFKEVAEDKKAALLAEANVQEENIIGFYNVNVLAKPVGDYTISIPMAKEYLDKAVSFYTWNEGEMSVLDLELKGNTYTGSAKCFDHLLIALGENGAAIADAETKDNSEKEGEAKEGTKESEKAAAATVDKNTADKNVDKNRADNSNAAVEKPGESSSSEMMIGICCGVVLLLIGGGVIISRSGKKKEEKKSEEKKSE